MSITSILRVATLSVSLIAATSTIGTAFASSENLAAQPQSNQTVSSGVYDGADFQAAKRAHN
jgi:hypothetical protein